MKRLAVPVLMVILTLGACQSDVACLTDDPFALHLIVRDRVSGVRLDGISGSVTSGPNTRPLVCFRDTGQEECYGWAAGSRAALHVIRTGSATWDTTGVQVTRVGACSRPVLRDLDVRLQPSP